MAFLPLGVVEYGAGDGEGGALARSSHADLVDDKAVADRIYGLIADEFALTREVYLHITGNADLTAENQRQARSLKRRYPYLLPLNAVQLELLRRYRAGDDQFLVSKTIQVTMNGLATALRNAG